MSTIDVLVLGTCENCHQQGDMRAVQIFTKGTDNSIDGIWKNHGFLHFEFVTVLCEKCRTDVKLFELFKNRPRVTEMFIVVTKSETGRIPFTIPDYHKVIDKPWA